MNFNKRFDIVGCFIEHDGRFLLLHRLSNVEQLTPESDFRKAYEHGVDSYWTNFGKERIEEERGVWRRIRDKAAE